VISVIGRLLEHSRIFYFQNGAADPVDGHFYIGSADWMYRNLQTRVEATVPIEDRGMRERLWEILQIMRNDRRQAWDMRPDGSYVQRKPESVADVGTQQMLTNLTRQRNTAVAVPARIGIARPSSYTMSQNGILDA
jgi:polyphosphate kinase